MAITPDREPGSSVLSSLEAKQSSSPNQGKQVRWGRLESFCQRARTSPPSSAEQNSQTLEMSWAGWAASVSPTSWNPIAICSACIYRSYRKSVSETRALLGFHASQGLRVPLFQGLPPSSCSGWPRSLVKSLFRSRNASSTPGLEACLWNGSSQARGGNTRFFTRNLYSCAEELKSRARLTGLEMCALQHRSCQRSAFKSLFSHWPRSPSLS